MFGLLFDIRRIHRSIDHSSKLISIYNLFSSCIEPGVGNDFFSRGVLGPRAQGVSGGWILGAKN